jgi:hypothetical protein
LEKSNEWSLSIFNGVHNHPMWSKLQGHLLACISTEKDKEIVIDLTRIMVEPKNILMNLKDKRKYRLTNIKQVCNAHQRFKKSIRAESSKMQHLLKCFKDHKYVYKFINKCDSTTVLDIFRAHVEFIKLFNTFPKFWHGLHI